MKDFFLSKIIQELEKNNRRKDIPVAALLIDGNNKIIATEKNDRETKKNISGHAEIKVINKIFKKTKSKNLSNYTMYVSLKPCLMCIAAIEQTNIKYVHYYLENIKCQYDRFKTKISFIKEEDKDKILEKKLKFFFKNLRNKL